jgi:calcineurin-like phosphoesterase family protein
MIWFTADWHFFHDRILDFHPKRKEIFGNNMKEVTEKMIQKWNSRIDKHDTVYILGDFAFGTTDEKRKLFQRLNGNKILILGNHDKVSDNHRCFFNHITQIKNMRFKKTVFPSLPKDIEVIMCHFPMFSWEHIEKGSIMLHGHCHGSVDLQNSAELPDHIRIDVGIDSSFANYDFVSINKLANFIKNYIKQ